MRPSNDDDDIVAVTGITDAREFLESVLAGRFQPSKMQFEAAKCLLPYQHGRTANLGKKETKRLQAHQLVGKFAPARRMTPKVVSIDGEVENVLS